VIPQQRYSAAGVLFALLFASSALKTEEKPNHFQSLASLSQSQRARVIPLWTAVLILVALVVGARPARSHDIPGLPGVQYPQSCCAGGDCEPAPCEDIEERRDGWHWRNLTFSRYMVRSSPDRRCHVCFGGKFESGYENRNKPALPRYILVPTSAGR
jgi:hypothetical protein